MTFVVEDGTGLANANSYVSVADADAYFADRGIAAWTGSNTVKEQALIRATDFIETVYGRRFRGSVATESQALSFPRYITDYDQMPIELKRSTYEYALRALSAALLPDPKTDASGLPVVRKTTIVGPIETTLQYGATVPELTKSYPAADMLIAGLIRSASVVRA